VVEKDVDVVEEERGEEKPEKSEHGWKGKMGVGGRKGRDGIRAESRDQPRAEGSHRAMKHREREKKSE